MSRRRVFRVLNYLLIFAFAFFIITLSLDSTHFLLKEIHNVFSRFDFNQKQLQSKQVQLEKVPRGNIKLTITDSSGVQLVKVANSNASAVDVLGLKDQNGLDKDHFIDATNVFVRGPAGVEISVDAGKEDAKLVNISVDGANPEYRPIGICKVGAEISTFALVRFVGTIKRPHVVYRGTTTGTGMCITTNSDNSSTVFKDRDGNPINNKCFLGKKPLDNQEVFNHYTVHNIVKNQVDTTDSTNVSKDIGEAESTVFGTAKGAPSAKTVATTNLIPGADDPEHGYPGYGDQKNKEAVYMITFNSADSDVKSNACWEHYADDPDYVNVDEETGKPEIGKPAGVLLYEPISPSYSAENRRTESAGFMDIKQKAAAKLPGADDLEAHTYGKLALYNRKETDSPGVEDILQTDRGVTDLTRGLLIRGYAWAYKKEKGNPPVQSELWYMSDSAEEASAESYKDWNRVPMHCQCESFVGSINTRYGYWTCKINFGVAAVSDIDSPNYGKVRGLAMSRGEYIASKYAAAVPGELIDKATVIELAYALGLLKESDKSIINDVTYRNLSDDELNELVCTFWPKDAHNKLPNMANYPVVKNFFYQKVKVDIFYTLPLFTFPEICVGGRCNKTGSVCTRYTRRAEIPLLMLVPYDESDNILYSRKSLPDDLFSDPVTFRFMQESMYLGNQPWSRPEMYKDPIVVDLNQTDGGLDVNIKFLGTATIIETYAKDSNETKLYVKGYSIKTERALEDWRTRLANHPRCKTISNSHAR